LKLPKDFTLLIVDDEDDLREIVGFHFQKAGFNVLTASGGNEAFDLVQNNKIDLVLSDIQMPNGSGIEMLEKIKAKFPGVPVVMFVTGYSSASEKKIYEKGAVAIFSKPFNKDAVLQAVMKAVGIAA